MTIKAKLLALVSLLLVSVALVGGVGFYAVQAVGSKIHYLTRETSPLQIKMLNLQQGFEKMAACFTQMALASSKEELAGIRERTQAVLAEIDATASDLNRLKADVDDKVFADIRKSYLELNRMAEERLACMERLASMNRLTSANGQLQAGIGMVTAEIRKLDEAMQGLQKDCYASIEKSKQTNNRANEQIKQLLVVKEKLSNAGTLILQASAVENRFRLSPLKDKMKTELDAIARVNLTPAVNARLKEFAEAMQKGYSGDGGLLAVRAELLANPKEKAGKEKFDAKQREIAALIDAVGGTIAMEIDNLELVLPQETGRMGQAVSTVVLVGGITNAGGKLSTLAQSIDSISRQIMLSSGSEDIAKQKKRVEAEFGEVAGTLNRMKKDLGALNRQDGIAAVAKVESAFRGMRDVILGRDGIADTVSRNVTTQARSAQIFEEAKTLIRKFAETGAEKTRTAESGQEKAVLVVEKVVSYTTTILVIAGLVSLGLGIVVGGWTTRSINAQLENVIEGLGASSGQVASAAGEVSGSSQELAEGASVQAASLEETTASMEEIAGKTRHNAENARQADELMRESGRIVKKANESMTVMGRSMENISAAGEKIGKIIKSIDQIAFQTNLLALNAAVEAARAGEAGMGFAVVADEVRALALRAAEAARNTNEIVGEVTKKIADGMTLVSGTEADFREVENSARKVAALVSEIATASLEQSHGADQARNALRQMDEVVQKNAAGAEKTASASEELNAQAETLREYVEQLGSLVGGKREREGRGASGLVGRVLQAGRKAHPAPSPV